MMDIIASGKPNGYINIAGLVDQKVLYSPVVWMVYMEKRAWMGLIFAVLVTLGLMIAFVVFFLVPRITCTTINMNKWTAVEKDAPLPHGSWDNMVSPYDGSKLEWIIIKKSDPSLPMRSFKYAYYWPANDTFWVAVMQFDELFWYGPFPGRPCEV